MKKHQAPLRAVCLLASFLAPLAFGEGQAVHHSSIHHSHHAHMMPQQIQNFNLSSQLAAQNLMDATARAALQAQANSLASQYKGLQQDAQGGNFDTSGMGDMMKGFANNVNNAELQKTHEVALDQKAAANDGGQTQQTQQAQNISIVVQNAPAPQPADAPSAVPTDAAVAQANEQIIPDLQSALNLPEAKAAPSATDAPASGLAASGAVALVPFAASGEKTDGFHFEQPAAAEGDHAHEARGLASVGGEGSLDSPSGEENANGAGGSSVVESENSGGVILGQGAAAAANVPALDKAAGKSKLPKGLLAGVPRVQGGADSKGGGFFSSLKKALFGASSLHKSSFYKPLDFPGQQPMEASLDEEDLWWQPLALPVVCTLIFCGLVYQLHTRQRRAVRGHRHLHVVAKRPPMDDDEKDPDTAVVTLAKFRKPNSQNRLS